MGAGLEGYPELRGKFPSQPGAMDPFEQQRSSSSTHREKEFQFWLSSLRTWSRVMLTILMVRLTWITMPILE